ncbi:MAG: single-stranded DNA-binding protein [Oculatellaceae cyanobacterium Prado106]|nr:single-stranded DNA-binding protein [Oculatellaceae cyanobacterium Prado106]
MNSCILMAEIIQDPQLRYTADNQTAVTEMVVQIPGLRDEEPPASLKVVGWGTLAQEIQEKFHVGDRIILEGRLGMNMVDRPEGFKEKRAELTVQRIHLVGADASLTTSSETTVTTSPAVPQPAPVRSAPQAAPKAAPKTPAASKAVAAPAPAAEPDYDEIPF